MKTKLIASILALTTILGAGTLAASKTMETKNSVNTQTKAESTSTMGKENTEDISWNVENEVNEDVRVEDEAAVSTTSTQDLKATNVSVSTKNTKSEEKVKNVSNKTQQDTQVEYDGYIEINEGWNTISGKMYYYKKASDGVLEAVGNSYVDGYFVNKWGVRTGEKCSTKVNSASEAESLIRANHKDYFGETDSTIHGKHEKKEYKVASIRNEYNFSDESLIGEDSLIDEPAYIIYFAGVDNESVYFSYAVGCYTGKVYMGNYKTPRLEEMKNGECVAKHVQ